MRGVTLSLSPMSREEGNAEKEPKSRQGAGWGVGLVWCALLLVLAQDQQGTREDDSNCRNCSVTGYEF
jgi:hypothetical protein